jgi:hypothetical protein
MEGNGYTKFRTIMQYAWRDGRSKKRLSKAMREVFRILSVPGGKVQDMQYEKL